MPMYWSPGTLPIKLLITWSALASTYPECDVERHRPALKQDREGIAFLHVTGQALEIHHRPHRLAVELFEAVGALQVARPFHRAPLELDQDVAGLESGLCGRAVRNHFVDEHALRVLGAKRASQLRGERLDRYAEPSARHAALVAELRVDLPCHVGGNRKADARASGDDCRVDPDHLALHVHERSAGVARIDQIGRAHV